MREQLCLDFDAARGRQLRDEGVRQVTNNQLERMTRIAGILRELATRQEFLTSDDLRNAVPVEDWPRSPQAWGAAMRNAAGVLEPAGPMEQSGLSSNHGRRILVWRSLLYRKGERGAA